MFRRGIKTRFGLMNNPLKNVDHLKNVVFSLKTCQIPSKTGATVNRERPHTRGSDSAFDVCVAKTLLVVEFVPPRQFSFLVLILYIISVI